jgi:hypothetical protein
LLSFLLDLLQLGRQFLATHLQFRQTDQFGLISIKQSLALSLQSLPSLEQLLLLEGES